MRALRKRPERLAEWSQVIARCVELVRALGGRVAAHPFGHGARSTVDGLAIFASYHCSRYNTNTGRLTEAMFRSVFKDVAGHLG